MPTQRDLETAEETRTSTRPPLAICAKCGWYDGYTHSNRCAPKLGRIADRLIAALPQFRGGKLGYGDHRVVFEISDDCHVLFEVHEDGFTLEEVHMLNVLTLDSAGIEAATKLVTIVAKAFELICTASKAIK